MHYVVAAAITGLALLHSLNYTAQHGEPSLLSGAALIVALLFVVAGPRK